MPVCLELVQQKFRSETTLFGKVDLVVPQHFGLLVGLFIVVQYYIHLSKGKFTEPSLQELSTGSSAFSYFLGFSRLLFFALMAFYQFACIAGVDYIKMLKNKIESRKLTTWKTKVCFSCFPYGSSAWPPIGTFCFTEAPAIMLTVELFLSGEIALSVYLVVLQVVIFIAMLKAMTTNPGILPQIVLKYQAEEELFAIPSKPYRQEHKYLITKQNVLHLQKYCAECHIYRPMRTVHCAACNHCVERYDHHCPWLAICIGKYNYKYFLVYLTSLVLLILSSLVIGITFTARISVQPTSVVSDFVVYMLVGLVALIFFIPITRLLIYHYQLIARGITTNQEIKKTYTIIGNAIPFDKLEYSIHREKRLPKFSYRLHKTKQPEIYKHGAQQQQIESELRDLEQSARRREGVSIINPLIGNQNL